MGATFMAIVGLVFALWPLLKFNKTHEAITALPPKMIWVWERSEDLRGLPSDIGVAYVAETLELRDSKIRRRWRAQTLQLDPQTAAVPVLHVDADGLSPADFTAEQLHVIVDELVGLATTGNRQVVQLDFEVRRSHQPFLRQVVLEARQRLPDHIALSVTALASWCEGDRWLNGMAADEIVPMAFRMASGDREIRAALNRSGSFKAPECRHAIGTATDEPLVNVTMVRHYQFSPKPWSQSTWLTTHRFRKDHS